MKHTNRLGVMALPALMAALSMMLALPDGKAETLTITSGSFSQFKNFAPLDEEHSFRRSKVVHHVPSWFREENRIGWL